LNRISNFHLFKDLTATNCTGVKSYVTNFIKAASSSGSSMNPMLKAQMLATALNVYFSDPALGGNKISAPVPIGGVTIDLTNVCKMIDGSAGHGDVYCRQLPECQQRIRWRNQPDCLANAGLCSKSVECRRQYVVWECQGHPGTGEGWIRRDQQPGCSDAVNLEAPAVAQSYNLA